MAPDTYMVQGVSALGSSANRNFISNAAFVVTPEGVLVVDALGSPALARELLAEIRRITPAPVRYVVVTHYHADHIYGLQVFKDAGATIIAHRDGRLYLNSDTAQLRLQASREELAPAVDAHTRLVAADRWIDGPTTLQFGGLDFLLQPAGPGAHPRGPGGVGAAAQAAVRRRPGVSRPHSLCRPGRQRPLDHRAGHAAGLRRAASSCPATARCRPARAPTCELTRDYLVYLRQTMGEAARNMDPFEEAYARTDWSRFDKLPLFDAANRINAYNTYLLMEQPRQMMRLDRRRSLAALAGTALGAAAWRPLLAAPAAPGEPVSWPQVRLLDGSPWGAAQADGKAVVAVFWSTTCPFCRRHNAHVEKLRQAAAGQPLELITIARENDPAGGAALPGAPRLALRRDAGQRADGRGAVRAQR